MREVFAIGCMTRNCQEVRILCWPNITWLSLYMDASGTGTLVADLPRRRHRIVGIGFGSLTKIWCGTKSRFNFWSIMVGGFLSFGSAVSNRPTWICCGCLSLSNRTMNSIRSGQNKVHDSIDAFTKSCGLTASVFWRCVLPNRYMK